MIETALSRRKLLPRVVPELVRRLSLVHTVDVLVALSYLGDHGHLGREVAWSDSIGRTWHLLRHQSSRGFYCLSARLSRIVQENAILLTGV